MRVEVFMMEKLIEDYLPAAKMNDDFRRRFYDMFAIPAPSWLEELPHDQWWEGWLHDRYQDAKQLIREGELEE